MNTTSIHILVSIRWPLDTDNEPQKEAYDWLTHIISKGMVKTGNSDNYIILQNKGFSGIIDIEPK